MELSRAFEVPVPEEIALTRMRTYLEQAGYRPSSLARVSYHRGSLLRSWLSFSPRVWQTEVHLAVVPEAADKTQVSVALNVNTKGQWLSGTERRFWDTEIDGLEAAAQSGTIDYGQAARAARTSVRSSLLAISVVIVDFVLVTALGLLTVFWLVAGALSIDDLSIDDLVEIHGTLTDYQQTDSGDLLLHLAGYQNTFRVNSGDMQLLDEQRFRQEIHGGEELHLSLTKYARNSLKDPSRETPVPVLGMRSETVTYLPPEAIVAVRAEQAREARWLLLFLTLACVVLLVPMLFITARTGLFSAIRQSLARERSPSGAVLVPGRWTLYHCQLQGKPAQVLLNMAARESAPDPQRTALLWVGVYCRKNPGGAFWHPAETETLDRLEDHLVGTVSVRTQGIYVLRIATPGIREYYFYAGSGAGLGDCVAATRDAFPKYKIQPDRKTDAEWSWYLTFYDHEACASRVES